MIFTITYSHRCLLLMFFSLDLETFPSITLVINISALEHRLKWTIWGGKGPDSFSTLWNSLAHVLAIMEQRCGMHPVFCWNSWPMKFKYVIKWLLLPLNLGLRCCRIPRLCGDVLTQRNAAEHQLSMSTECWQWLAPRHTKIHNTCFLENIC